MTRLEQLHREQEALIIKVCDDMKYFWNIWTRYIYVCQFGTASALLVTIVDHFRGNHGFAAFMWIVTAYFIVFMMAGYRQRTGSNADYDELLSKCIKTRDCIEALQFTKKNLNPIPTL